MYLTYNKHPILFHMVQI